MELDKVDRLNPQLRRRDFLAYGAGAALLPSVSWAALDGGGKLALGHCREPLPDAEDAAAAVVPADRLGSGDPELARRGVRVTVHGLVGDAGRLAETGIRALDLTVRYELSEAGCGGVDFHAWSYRSLPVEQIGSPCSFAVPVEAGLGLALEVETLAAERAETVLVAGRGPGLPKLRSGRYLIAPAGVLPRRFDRQPQEPLLVLSVEPA